MSVTAVDVSALSAGGMPGYLSPVRRQRVLVLNQYYWPGVEATAQLLAQLCEALALDYDVTVVTGHLRGHDLPARETRNGVEIVRVRSTAYDRSRIHLRAANYASYLGDTVLTALRGERPVGRCHLAAGGLTMAHPIPRTAEPDASSACAPLRVAVIGVGRIGRMHAELLAARVPDVALAAVCDALPDAARAVAVQLGVDVAAGVDDVFGAEDVDAVAICSSTPTHPDLIARAAAAGKAILCEKPVSLDLVELDGALAAVARAGVPFQIGFNRRFDPSHQAVRDAVAGGAIGEPHLARISSRDPAPPPL